MPFVPQENRKKIKETGAWDTVGDLCYMKYLPMIQKWRKNRRWTQAHNTTRETFGLSDEQAARLLAWFVYMSKEVMPYEKEKCEENGDING
jgi:hypothetical protein